MEELRTRTLEPMVDFLFAVGPVPLTDEDRARFELAWLMFLARWEPHPDRRPQ